MGQIQNKILDNRQGRGCFGGIQPVGNQRRHVTTALLHANQPAKSDSVVNDREQRLESFSKNALQKPWKKGSGTFAPAGQSTQMIVGASPETDRQILRLTESLYHRYRMKRVFYSAYIPVVEDSRLPSKDITPPLWREHRLYQADWLLRFYGFSASELLDEKNPQLHPYLDPKCHWAVRHPELFPMEVNRASFDELVRVPGVGVESALRILKARKLCPLNWDGLKNIGVVLKRARYFLLCKGKPFPFLSRRKEDFLLAMMSPKERALFRKQECSWFQPSLFTDSDLAFGGEESSDLTTIALPGLDDRQKEALQCISIPVFS